MDGSSTNGTTRNVTVIRATPAQTAILQKEFAISDMPASEKIKALSEQTTLPPKWIHNWFGRQRTKANKPKSKAGQQGYTGTYSLDPTFSPQEILRIKREQADGDALSGSSPITEATSVSDYATISVSSSGTLDASVASEPPRKKRGRPPQKKKTSPARNLRSSKRKVAAIPSDHQTMHVKAELVESSGSLPFKLVEGDSSIRPALSGINAGNLKNTAMAYSHFIPSVAPPKRSPMTAPNKATGSKTRNTRSGLSANQPDSIYGRLPTDGIPSEKSAAVRDLSTQTRFARNQKPQKAASLRGPVFHTRFENNSPENLGPSRMLPSVPSSYPMIGTSIPMSSLSFSDVALPMVPQSQPSNVTFYNGVVPLAPAFDWGNHSPSSGNVAMSSNQRVVSHAALESDQYLAESSHAYHGGHDYSYNNQFLNPETMPPNESTLQSTKPKSLAAVLLAAHQDIIDPALAPLKHLTDVLGDFKDEHGTYIRLLAYEERDNLLKCLLDETLLQNNPFQAAMALSLLSKLGFEWDY